MSCDCCEPTSGLTPLHVDNRAGLSAIAYRVGTYASFRATMLERISAQPELDGLTTRDDDDPAIAVLSMWAAVAASFSTCCVTRAFRPLDWISIRNWLMSAARAAWTPRSGMRGPTCKVCWMNQSAA